MLTYVYSLTVYQAGDQGTSWYTVLKGSLELRPALYGFEDYTSRASWSGPSNTQPFEDERESFSKVRYLIF